MAAPNRSNTFQSSKVDNRGAQYQGVRDVYNGPVIKKTVVRKEKSVTYGINKKDVKGLETWAMFLMKTLGLKKTVWATVASFVVGLSSTLLGVYQKPVFVAPIASQLLLGGVVCIFVGAALGVALQYRYQSRCVKCNTFFAMGEVGKPTARETPTRDGIRIETTRTYRCKFCGNTNTETSSELQEEDEEGQ